MDEGQNSQPLPLSNEESSPQCPQAPFATNSDLMKLQIKFCSAKDLLNLRLTNKLWNSTISDSLHLNKSRLMKLSTDWRTGTLQHHLLEHGLKIQHYKLAKFVFLKKGSIFQEYWTKNAEFVTQLDITAPTSLECISLRFLLSRCLPLETLNLVGCRFRDFYEYHVGGDGDTCKRKVRVPTDAGYSGDIDEGTISHNDLQALARFDNDSILNKNTSPLRNLTLDHLLEIDSCHIEYLIKRTGNLRMLQISSCLNENVQESSPEGLKFTKLGQKFQDLILHNANTLEDLRIMNNFKQQSWFQALAAFPAANSGFNDIPLLTKITFSQTAKKPSMGFSLNLAHFQQFLQMQKNVLVELQLDFRTIVWAKAETYDNLLVPMKNLRKLSLAIEKSATKVSLPQLTPTNFPHLSHIIINECFTEVGKPREPSFLKTDFLNTIGGQLTTLETHNWFQDRSWMQMYFQPILAKEKVTQLLTSRFKLADLTSLNVTGHIAKGDHVIPAITFDVELQLIIRYLRKLVKLCITSSGITDQGPMGWYRNQCYKGLIGQIANVFPIPMKGNTHPVPISACNVRFNSRNLSTLEFLQHLDLSHNGITDFSLFGAIIFSDLTYLNLMFCPRLTDVGMESLPRGVPKLKELNIRHCPNISECGMNFLVVKCKQLQCVHASQVHLKSIPRFVYQKAKNFDDIVRNYKDDQEKPFSMKREKYLEVDQFDPKRVYQYTFTPSEDFTH